MAISSTAYTSLAVQVVKKINDNILDTETVSDTLLRILGLTNKDQSQQGFVIFLKKKDKSSLEAKSQFVRYLKGLKSRLDKWNKDANTVRINKIKRLLGENGDVPQTDITVDDTLEVALQKLQKFKKQLAEQQDKNGLLNTEYAFYQAALDKIDSVLSVIPTDEMGVFGPELVSIMRADSSVLNNTVKRFQRQKIGLETELARLQNDEAYLQTGATLEKAATGQKLSLATVVSVCVYFAEKIDYQCKECIYFDSNLCLYGGNKFQTKSDNSCLDVYKKSENPFWRASAETVTKVRNEAIPGGAQTTSTVAPVPPTTATPAPAPAPAPAATSAPATTSSSSSSSTAPATSTASTAPTAASRGQTTVPTQATPTQQKSVIPSQQIDESKVSQRTNEIIREWNAAGKIGDPNTVKFRASNQARSEQIKELKKQNPNWGT